MKDWLEKYFSEHWEEVNSDIDFKKLEPIETSSSLHIYEEKYIVDEGTYRLLYVIGGNDIPTIEKLIK